jgi:spermidine synthase
MKSSSLFVEQNKERTAFYIDGDLQFDSSDEACYHEYLVLPALDLARRRHALEPLRVLICGGGDGLAARDVLRFPEVERIDLVDYNPEVVDFGRTLFAPFNKDALDCALLTVHLQDALTFVESAPAGSYHVVICDFTHPRCEEDAAVYAVGWFEALRWVLVPGGIVSTNATSPERSPEAFWCIHQSILAAGLTSYPLHRDIASFRRAGYGRWGFFLASPEPIGYQEAAAIDPPAGAVSFRTRDFLAACRFPRRHAEVRHSVNCHLSDVPSLCHYLWNSECDEDLGGCFTAFSFDTVEFFSAPDAWNGLLPEVSPGSLAQIARSWLEASRALPSGHAPNLVPVRHPYHTTEMTNSWGASLPEAVKGLDLSELVRQMLKRAQSLPANLVDDLRKLLAALQAGTLPKELAPRLQNILWLVLAAVLTMHLSHPDAVFAKGGGGSNSSNSDDTAFWGTMLAGGGIIWLVNLYNRNK